jgi:hypothetical protein
MQSTKRASFVDSGNFFGVSKIIAIIGQPSDIDRTTESP